MIELIYMLIALGFFLGNQPIDDTEDLCVTVFCALLWPVSLGVAIANSRSCIECNEDK